MTGGRKTSVVVKHRFHCISTVQSALIDSTSFGQFCLVRHCPPGHPTSHWHPMLNVPPNHPIRIHCKSILGKYWVVIQYLFLHTHFFLQGVVTSYSRLKLLVSLTDIKTNDRMREISRQWHHMNEKNNGFNTKTNVTKCTRNMSKNWKHLKRYVLKNVHVLICQAHKKKTCLKC